MKKKTKQLASLAIQNMSSEDSNQTKCMRKLIINFSGRTCLKVHFLTLQIMISVYDQQCLSLFVDEQADMDVHSHYNAPFLVIWFIQF